MQKVEMLRHFKPFDELAPGRLEQFESFLIRKSYERREHLRHESQIPSSFMFVLEGSVRAMKHRSDGSRLVVGVYAHHQPPGNIAAYLREPSPVSVSALEDTTVLQAHYSHLIREMRDDPLLLKGLIREMAHQNRRMMRRLREFAAAGAERRLAMLFSRLAQMVGQRRRTDGGEMVVRIELPLSRRDLAGLINMRIETVIRHMSRWDEEGPVRTEPGGFTVVDHDRLRRLAGDEQRDGPPGI